MSDMNQETKVVDLLERDNAVTATIEEKPYRLRKLSAKDISPMLKIVKKVDIRKLKNVLNDLDLSEITNAIKANQKEEDNNEIEEENNNMAFAKIGEALIFEAIPLVLDALDNSILEINKLLASVANMELSELENLDLDVYFNLIYDFINKEEFAGFMKVVSKFLNSEK